MHHPECLIALRLYRNYINQYTPIYSFMDKITKADAAHVCMYVTK